MANRGDCSCHVWSEDRPGRTTSCSSRLAALWPVGSIYSSTLYSTASIISLFANKTSYVSVQTRLSLSKQNAVHCLGTIIQTCYLVFVDIILAHQKRKHYFWNTSYKMCLAIYATHLTIIVILMQQTNHQTCLPCSLLCTHCRNRKTCPVRLFCGTSSSSRAQDQKCFFFCHHTMYKLQLLIKT
jgi:hypothetical protein